MLPSIWTMHQTNGLILMKNVPLTTGNCLMLVEDNTKWPWRFDVKVSRCPEHFQQPVTQKSNARGCQGGVNMTCRFVTETLGEEDWNDWKLQEQQRVKYHRVQPYP